MTFILNDLQTQHHLFRRTELQGPRSGAQQSQHHGGGGTRNFLIGNKWTNQPKQINIITSYSSIHFNYCAIIIIIVTIIMNTNIIDVVLLT